MRQSELVKYYLQKEFLDFIIEFSRGREVVPRFRDYFGKRPQIVSFKEEALSMIRSGLTSFHVSLERWVNPMRLSAEIKQQEMDELRTGWDLILDIDALHFDFAKPVALLLVEALKFFDVSSFSLKFSGRAGFHLGIPFEAFPSEISGKPLRLLFPDAARTVGFYLSDFISEFLSEKLLDTFELSEISKLSGKDEDELLGEDGLFNPYSVVNIDAVAISPRHLIRSPFSLNEKTWLASIPVRPEDILSFNPLSATPSKVVFSNNFLKPPKNPDASRLLVQAFDWKADRDKKVEEKKREESLKNASKRDFSIPSTAFLKGSFPPCINLILSGLSDGRKRSLFCLINFFRSSGWDFNSIEAEVHAWNARNKEMLPESYIKSQLDWHRRSSKLVLPPNCISSEYYKDIGVCKPDNLCSKIKNPLSYAYRKSKANQEPSKKKRSN